MCSFTCTDRIAWIFFDSPDVHVSQIDVNTDQVAADTNVKTRAEYNRIETFKCTTNCLMANAKLIVVTEQESPPIDGVVRNATSLGLHYRGLGANV